MNEKHEFSALLVEFVGRVLIEKMFFQNLYIPPDLLLSLANNLIQTLSPEQKTKLDVYKEGIILYKQLRGISLTPEEQRYDNAMKEIDVLGEFLKGMKYSALGLMGSNLYTSVTSAIQQGLWNHVPAIMGYSSAIVLGPHIIQRAVETVLAYSGLTQAQKKQLTPWLNTIARLALGFIPKVRANEKGIHYHYPSMAGHTKTITSESSVTLAGDQVVLERQGVVYTSEGEFEADYAVQFKLHSIYEITEEKIKLQVINAEGQKIPVEFYINQEDFGKKITVKSTDKQLEAHWEKYFIPKVVQEEILSLPDSTEIKTNIAQTTDLTCHSALALSAVTSIVGQNALPLVLAALNCIPKVSGVEETQAAAASNTFKRHLEQTSNASLNIVNLPLDNQLQDMVIDNNYAYAVNGPEGLKIFDISNPDNITLVSQYNITGSATRIVLDKGYAYIAAGSGGLQIINVKSPANPIFAGLWMTGNAVIDVAVMNGKAYIADGTNTLTEIDVSVPESVYFAIVAVTDARNVAVLGNYACVVDYYSSLRIVNISNIENPAVIGSISISTPSDVVVSGNFAYVADSSYLRVINISNPANPSLVGSGTISSMYIEGIAVSGNFVYIADSAYPGFRIFDVSNPTNPGQVGSLIIPTATPYDVAVSGKFAYLASGSSLCVIDISNSVSPKFVGNISTVNVQAVDVSGNFTYLTEVGSSGTHTFPILPSLRIIDVSNVTNLKQVASIGVAHPNDVFIAGNFAYVADAYFWKVIDISNVTKPRLINNIGMTSAQGVAVLGNYAYVPDSNSGLKITRINPVIAPQYYAFRNVVSQLSSANNYLWVMQSEGFQAFDVSIPVLLNNDVNTLRVIDVSVLGDFAYVADFTGLLVINVSNSTAPRVVGNVSTTAAYAVAVSGNNAYVGDFTSGLSVIDVSNPTNPILIGNVSTSYPMDIAVLGNFTYVGDYSTFCVIDVSNAAHPKLLGNISTTYASGVAVSQNYAYVADSSSVRIIDVSNPTNLILVNSISTSGVQDVALVGNFIYVAYFMGLLIFDVSNATKPSLVGKVSTSDAYGIAVSGNNAYIADYYSGFKVIDISNVSNPYIKYGFGIPGVSTKVTISSNIAYIGGSLGLTIFDTMQPLPWLSYNAISPAPQKMSIVYPYAFIANNNALSIWNISNPMQVQYLGEWNTSFITNHIEVIGNEILLGHANGVVTLDISNPSNPSPGNNYICGLPVQNFVVNNGTLYFPGAYQCRFQPATVPQPPINGLTPCPVSQLLVLRYNEIQINKGQNLRLTPNDLSASCGNNTSPNLGTIFNITGIDHAQIRVRNSSSFWNNASSFFGSDLSQGNVALIQDNTTSAPYINFTVTDGQTILFETSVNIQFNDTKSTISVTGIDFEIQFNNTTVLKASDFQITDIGTKLDNVVITVNSMQGGYFSLVNSSIVIIDFTYYQPQDGQIQFVHNSTELPRMTLKVGDGSAQDVLISPLVRFFDTHNPNSSPVPAAAIGGSIAVAAAAGLAAFGLFKFKQNQARKVEELANALTHENFKPKP